MGRGGGGEMRTYNLETESSLLAVNLLRTQGNCQYCSACSALQVSEALTAIVL